MTDTVILLTGLTGSLLERLVSIYADAASVMVAHDRATLEALTITADSSLISFGTAVIVRPELLERFQKPVYNLHAAPPEFPGRDPHHHAVYRGATEYGATLHIMTNKVDAGPIVAIETFPVSTAAAPSELLAAGNEAGIRLLERLGTRLLCREPLPHLPYVEWGKVKTARSDLHKLCELSPLISKAEFERRRRAFEDRNHNNLTTRIHGHLFRIEKGEGNPTRKASRWAEFTEEAFLELLRQLKTGGYGFARFGEMPTRRHVLWRHDVDFSLHRAARLAEIEAEMGASATYFINPRSSFYSLLEPKIVTLTRRIRSLGHEIGLHFDAEAFGVTHWTDATLKQLVTQERELIEMILGRAGPRVELAQS